MLSTFEALKKGYEAIGNSFTFKFGDGYELVFERLIFDNQMYVALYKDQELLTDKVVVKPGYVKQSEIAWNVMPGPWPWARTYGTETSSKQIELPQEVEYRLGVEINPFIHPIMHRRVKELIIKCVQQELEEDRKKILSAYRAATGIEDDVFTRSLSMKEEKES